MFITWQDPENREWLPVGRLTRRDTEYSFVYTQGARVSRRFVPFGRMNDFESVYRSQDLFPLFANRLLHRGRPEFKSFLDWLNLTDEEDPLELLARTGGIRVTDGLAVFPCPVENDLGCYVLHFFVHGTRYLPPEVQALIRTLEPHRELFLLPDPQNHVDAKAIAIRSEEPTVIVGYCPRYLTSDLHSLLDEPGAIRLIVEKVNPDAPSQLRLLCEFQAPWPESFEPCSGELYEPLSDFADTGRRAAVG